MCGIVGYIGSKQAAPILLDGLSKLEYRGYDSAGIAVRDGADKFKVVKAKGRLKGLIEKTDEGRAVPGTCGIGHTRWATHGEPSELNAHPHISDDGNVVGVHNGIIENYQELKVKLLKKGYEFYSSTDTEVAVKLVDYYYKKYEHTPVDAINHAMVRIRGSYALALMFAEYPEEVYVARKDSPMIIGVSEGNCYVASDVPAILNYTRNVYYIGNLEIGRLAAGKATFYNLDGDEIEKELVEIKWDAEAAEKGGYEHFMLKEIMEQPRAIKSTLDPRVKDHRVVFDELKMTDAQLMGFNKIMITACGSAFYAGQAGKYALEKLTHIPVDADLASEFRYRDPIVDEHTLMIIISQSGETADTIAAIREAQSKGAYVLSIVNVVGSTIARISDDVIYTWAGPEIAVATTKGYTTQVSVLYLLALYLGEKRGCLSREEAAKLTDDLMILPQMVQRAIDLNPQIAQLAERYKNNPSLFFIGRNVDYAVCMEGSLKLKEISYLHSEA